MAKYKPDKHVVNMGVSGHVQLDSRPHIADVVKASKAQGKKTVLVFENETRLSRSMKVQEGALEWAAKNCVTLV